MIKLLILLLNVFLFSNNIYLSTTPSCTPTTTPSSNFDPLRCFAPLFYQFRWLRIVLDEGHEVMTDAKGDPIFGVMSDYQSVFRFNLLAPNVVLLLPSSTNVYSLFQVVCQRDAFHGWGQFSSRSTVLFECQGFGRW